MNLTWPNLTYIFGKMTYIVGGCLLYLLTYIGLRSLCRHLTFSWCTPFKINDKVWLESKNLKLRHESKKLAPKREGPFVITEVLNPLNYRLSLPESWRIHPIFHASLLSPFKHTDVHGENFIRPPPDLIEEQPEYEIEAIISHRRSGKGRAYLVKWKGYPTSENTWEPEQNLYNAREILKQYKIRHQLWKDTNPITQITMEATSNSPPPYEPEDIIELTNNFNSLQHFTEHQDDMLIYRSDYQIFDNNWRIWKHLERTKWQLQENILRTRLMVEQTEQQQRFLLTKANRYYHIIVTPEIRRRMNEPKTVGHLLHPNTPTLRLRPLSPPPFISTEEITYQTALSSTTARQGLNTITITTPMAISTERDNKFRKEAPKHMQINLFWANSI